MARAAAFFDLDKTLMAGSSGMPFARVAAQHGIVSRRQLASWGVEHLRYRLRGTTDERTTRRAAAGPRADRRGPGARRRADEARGAGRRSCRGSTRRCSTRSTPTRTPGARPSSSAPPATAWSSRWPRVLGIDGGSAPATRSTPRARSPGASTGPSSTARARSRRCGPSPPSTRSTWPTPTPTRTRSRTCRCCARSATRWSSTRTRRWPRSPSARAGRRCASSASAAACAIGAAAAAPSAARRLAVAARRSSRYAVRRART